MLNPLLFKPDSTGRNSKETVNAVYRISTSDLFDKSSCKRMLLGSPQYGHVSLYTPHNIIPYTTEGETLGKIMEDLIKEDQESPAYDHPTDSAGAKLEVKGTAITLAEHIRSENDRLGEVGRNEEGDGVQDREAFF